MEKGFIGIHREILDWEWYTDVNVCKVFIHLLLKANFKPKNWRGIFIDRGQLVTSLDHLAIETGLSLQKVRTALDKLVSTGEIEKLSTNQNTLLTIVKYGYYQNFDNMNNKPITDDQQTDNNQSTTTKESKKRKDKYCALSYVKEKNLDRYKEFINTYKPQIDNWEKFETDFKGKCILESLPLDTNKILARANIFAGNWIERQKPLSKVELENKGYNPEKAIEWFIEMFNNKGSGQKLENPLKYKATDNTKKLLYARINQEYNHVDFIKATRNMFSGKNKWGKNSDYQWASPKHMLTEKNFERYVNAKWE